MIDAHAGAVRAGASVRDAIARAAQATGVDFSYLLAQAKLESSLDPGAQASGSSAAGLYQFTRGTWTQMLDRHGAEHGLGWAGEAVSGGRGVDPAVRAQAMDLRFDPGASAMMAAELATDNRAALTSTLGREPDPAELYLGHFLGAAGAVDFLSALASDPGRSAAGVVPKAAAANRTIFYGPGGARSLEDVMDLIRGRMAAAMQGGADTATAVYGQARFVTASAAPGPLAQEFQAARAALPVAATRSMAETLQAAFGASASAPANVRDAYAKLAGLGL